MRRLILIGLILGLVVLGSPSGAQEVLLPNQPQPAEETAAAEQAEEAVAAEEEAAPQEPQATTPAEQPEQAPEETESSTEETTEEGFADEERTAVTMKEGLSKKISLDLRGIDIINTFKFLSMKGNLNIVASKNVTGRVTLFIKDVTIGDALDVILLTNDLALVKDKNILTIMTEAEFEQLYGKQYTDKREVKTLKIEYSLPSKIGAALESIKSSIGKLIMDDETGTLVMIDTPEKLQELEQMALELDQSLIKKKPRTTTKIFELEYANVADIETKVAEALTADLGTVRSDERTNRLFVQDLPYKLKEIEEMVTAFDAKTREVVIDAKIVEITLNDDFAMGINWEKVFETTTKDIRFVGSFPLPSWTTGQGGQISIGAWRRGFYEDGETSDQVYGEGEMDQRFTQQVLTFLKSVGKVKIVSSPRIAVCNNEEATIHVGSKQSYATSTISQSESTSTTSWSAESVDLGVKLTVTPTINKSGFVKMHIKPEVTTLSGWFEITDESGVTQISLPETDTSTVETDVLIQDGRTIIIAGLIKESQDKSQVKIPILGDIPILGGLFRSTSNETETKELVILITPHIISGGEDMIVMDEIEKVKKPKKE